MGGRSANMDAIRMKKRIKKNIQMFLIFGILVFLIFPLISAIAISVDFHKDNPVKVGPGDVREVVVGRLQNLGDKDKIYEIEMLKDDGVAILAEDSLVIPAGTTNTELKVRISIPPEISEGTKYEVVVRIKDITVSEGDGMVTLGESMQTSLPILVEKTGVVEKEEPAKTGLSVWWWVLGIIVVVVVLWIVFKTMKKSSVNEVPVK